MKENLNEYDDVNLIEKHKNIHLKWVLSIKK